MGLYDEVICEFPLPDGFQESRFQTKDLQASMITYRITEDGILERELREYHSIPEEERGPYGFPLFQSECIGWEDTRFHGVFDFYTHERVDDKLIWHEYSAKFTDGKLVEIKKVEET